MARPPKPWFWRARKCWYVTIQGNRIQLTTDKAKSLKLSHELMLRPAEPVPVVDAVDVILDRFLDWVQLHRSEST